MDEIGERITRIKGKVLGWLSEYTGGEGDEESLRPCLTEDEIAEFERKSNVRLPEEYRRALLEIMDGIVFEDPVGEMSEPFFYPLAPTPNLDKPFPLTAPYYDGDYTLVYGEEDIRKRGTLTLCPDESGGDFYLIVTGEARGQVWHGDSDTGGPCLPHIDFLAWYEACLDAGRDEVGDIIWAGYNSDGTVKE
jgi:SMI1 / KNR4 family (SUKH-1)